MSANYQAPVKKKSSFGNFGKNFFLVVISLLASLAVMEGVLRIYNPLGFRMKGDKIILPVNKNEIIHHGDSSKLDKLVVLHRNSLGFRGPEPPPDLDQRLSIIAVGGSTTECFELADDKTWVYDLDARLRQDFNRLWVNNAGLSGHSTFAHFILMEDFIAKIKPKVAIFLIGINDLGMVEAKEAGRILDKGLTLQSFRSLERFLSAFSEYSEVAAVGLNLKRYFFPKVTPIDTYREIDPRTARTLEVPEEVKSAMLLDYRHKVRFFEGRVKKLIEVSRENGIDPVLVTQPALYGKGAVDDITGVNLGKLRVLRDQPADGEVAWDILELYNGVTRKVGQDEQVLVIDLARELPKSSRYYYDLIHYSNEGAQKVADIIYQHLSPYLAPKYPAYTLAGATYGRK